MSTDNLMPHNFEVIPTAGLPFVERISIIDGLLVGAKADGTIIPLAKVRQKRQRESRKAVNGGAISKKRGMGVSPFGATNHQTVADQAQ